MKIGMILIVQLPVDDKYGRVRCIVSATNNTRVLFFN